MLTRADLAAYIADLTDSELMEFAARVVAWRATLVQDESYYWPLMHAFVAVHNEFGDRKWHKGYLPSGSGIDPLSYWGRVHARAAVLRADSTPERARKQIAAWARTVRLVAA